MGNVISLKWQTYHRHMVNTGDWQLFSILRGRQYGLGHVWGQQVAFQGPETKWSWSEIDEFLIILPNRIQWENSIYDIISLCTSVNFICHVCDQLILLNRCIDDDILILPAMTMTFIYQDLSQIPDLIYDWSSVWHQTITKTNANLLSVKPIKMHKPNGYLPQNSNIIYVSYEHINVKTSMSYIEWE